jgi:hypothetical protein
MVGRVLQKSFETAKSRRVVIGSVSQRRKVVSGVLQFPQCVTTEVDVGGLEFEKLGPLASTR